MLLEGWHSIYSSACSGSINIEDRKTLCAGITRVLVVLPPDQWSSSLSTLANPTIECIDMLLKSINSLQGPHDTVEFEESLSRMSEEICVFATILRTFHSVAKKLPNTHIDQVKAPLLALLHRFWPYVTHASKSFSNHDIIISSISEFLLVTISLQENGGDANLIKESSDIAMLIMDTTSQHESCNISPIMEFAEEMIGIFGFKAEEFAKCRKVSPPPPTDNLAQEVYSTVERLVCKSFQIIREKSEQSNIDSLPGLFSVCRACIRNCPILFSSICFSQVSTESIFSASLNASIQFVNSRHIDIVRAALLYLNECVSTH